MQNDLEELERTVEKLESWCNARELGATKEALGLANPEHREAYKARVLESAEVIVDYDVLRTAVNALPSLIEEVKRLREEVGDPVAWRWRLRPEAYGVAGATAGDWYYEQRDPAFPPHSPREVQPLYAARASLSPMGEQS
jgi:predicted transcriptional regulator